MIIKVWEKVIVLVIVILALLFSAFYMFVMFNGKDIIVKQLEGLTHKKVSLEFFDLTLPFNIEIRNLNIEGLAKVADIYISPSIPYLLTGNIALSQLKIISPEFIFEKNAPKAAEPAAVAASTQPVVATQPAQPVVATQPAQPAAVAESTQPAAATQPAQPATTAQPAQPAATAQPTQPAAETQPAQPATATQPAQPVATGESALTLAAPATPAESQQSAPLRLIIKRLNIKDGKINFIDHTAGEKGITIIVKDINFNLTNLYTFPYPAVANFDLSGRIPWQEGQAQGKLEAEGWLNFFKRDIRATLKITDIDGIYLYPYYSKWVDLEKARIEKASLSFTSNIHGLNNDVTAECHLELSDIVRKPRAPEEPEARAEKIADVVLDMFKSSKQGKIALDFTIKTKMDRPEFSFGNIKTAVENKLIQARGNTNDRSINVLFLPTRLLEGVVRSAADLSKAVIDGSFAVGNELKNAVEGSFKKEPK